MLVALLVIQKKQKNKAKQKKTEPTTNSHKPCINHVPCWDAPCSKMRYKNSVLGGKLPAVC